MGDGLIAGGVVLGVGDQLGPHLLNGQFAATQFMVPTHHNFSFVQIRVQRTQPLIEIFRVFLGSFPIGPVATVKKDVGALGRQRQLAMLVVGVGQDQKGDGAGGARNAIANGDGGVGVGRVGSDTGTVGTVGTGTDGISRECRLVFFVGHSNGQFLFHPLVGGAALLFGWFVAHVVKESCCCC